MTGQARAALCRCPMPVTATPELVLELIREHQLVEAPESLTADSPLFAAGLDSMAVMQLLLHLDERFGVTLDPPEMNHENLTSARALGAFLAQKAGRMSHADL